MTPHKSPRTVAIVDDASSVQYLMESVVGRLPIDDWLALTPPAAMALQAQGIQYHVSDDYFAEADLLGNLDDRLNLQFQWAAWVNRFLQDRIPEFAQFNLSPALTFFYHAKNFFDRFTVQRFGLEAFFSYYLPQKVVWAPTDKAIIKERHLIGCHYVDMILPALALERGVELIRIKLPAQGGEKVNKFSTVIKKRIYEIWLRANIRFEAMWLTGTNRDKSWRARWTPKPRILVLQNRYDMRFVLPQLRAAGVRFAYPPLNKLVTKVEKIKADSMQDSLAAAWKAISHEPQFWSLLEGWDAGREVVEPWLSHLWHRSFLEFWQMFKLSREYFLGKKYQGVIISNPLALKPYARLIGFVAAARSMGIPIFSTAHGTLPGYCHQPVQVFWDMPFSDYHLAYGPGVAEYLNCIAARYPYRHAVAVSGGSPMIDAIRKRHSPKRATKVRHRLVGSDERPLILYIPNFSSYHRRLSGDSCACMPYFELQKQIIQVFSKFPDIRIIYRIFPAQWPDVLINLAKAHIPDVIIATPARYKLSDLMWVADCIILDYPATPLGEILLTEKPIIVLSDNRYYKMVPEAKELLSKRVKLANNLEEYLSLIYDYLQKKDFNSIVSPNNEFRRYYITDKDDGQSAPRFADGIMHYMAEHL